jgi:hypothetical protein
MTERLCVTCIYKSGGECTKQWKHEPSIDPVYGRKRAGSHFRCSTQRQFESNSCGAAGKWWRSKDKFPKEIIIAKERARAERSDNIFSRAIKGVLNLFNG